MWSASRIATGAPEGARTAVLAVPLLVLVLVLVSGCAGTLEPEALPPQAVVPSAEPRSPDQPPEAPARTEAPSRVSLPSAEPIVIDPGEDTRAGSRGLAEAAEAERLRRDRTEAPVHVIDDENLADHATGDLTVAGGVSAGPVEESPPDAETPASVARDEAYWRSTMRDARLDWRDAWDRITVLENRAADLRRRFYSEDDPWVRDTRIKPELDRTSAELGQSRMDVEAAREAVDVLLEEGHRAGALPGWLREGVEFEPPAVEQEPEGEPRQGAEPREPTVVDETGGEGE